jgi:hypothetical protein
MLLAAELTGSHNTRRTRLNQARHTTAWYSEPSKSSCSSKFAPAHLVLYGNLVTCQRIGTSDLLFEPTAELRCVPVS